MKQGLTFLVVITVLALIAVAVFVPGEYSGDDPASDSVIDTLLLPGLAARVNDLQRVEIITAGDSTVATLVKADGRWQLEQMGGYHANWPKLQQVLAGLALAQVLEVKTDKPEYYAKLGVEDVGSPGAGSVLVKLGSGDDTQGILIGNQAKSRAGQYVRLQDSGTSVLLDRTLVVPTRQMDWVDRKIIDINAAEVAEVQILHPEAGRVFVTKISADQTDFDFVGLPPDREVKSSWAVNSLGSVLSLLELESVRPADNIDWQDAVRMRLLTFSGLEIMADMVMLDGDYLVRLQASHPAAGLVKAGNKDIDKQVAEHEANKVMDINQRVNGWAYGIAVSRFETMVKTPEDILKPVGPR